MITAASKISLAGHDTNIVKHCDSYASPMHQVSVLINSHQYSLEKCWQHQ